jgi:calcium-dependent protein kinase
VWKKGEFKPKELDILKALNHPNILKLYDFLENDNYGYIITEYCTGGNILDQLTKSIQFSERRTALIIK